MALESGSQFPLDRNLWQSLNTVNGEQTSPIKRTFRPPKRQRREDTPTPFQPPSPTNMIPFPFLFSPIPNQLSTQQQPILSSSNSGPLDLAQQIFNAEPNQKTFETQGSTSNIEDIFTCRVCSKQFTTQHGLIVHMRRYVEQQL